MSVELRLRGLGLRHAGQRVLDDVSLSLRSGDSLCLVGASGGGKSLIAAAAAGLLPHCMTATGEIQLGGEVRAAADQAGLRALWHRHLCLLPQEPGAALAPLLRAADQLRLSPPLLSREAACDVLARFGLDHAAARRFPAELSGGMAQRLLSALVSRSQAGVLIVDEPTKGLDPARRAAAIAMLLALRAAGRALLVITHDLDVVRGIGGGLAVLEEGGIAETGPVETVLASPRTRFLRACLAADPRHWAVSRKPGVGDMVATAGDLVIARGQRRLAGPLTFDLRQGQVTALLGASGAGKTTLGDTLLGMERPRQGTIRWLGRPLDRITRRMLRPRFQKLHQDPTAVFPPGRSFAESFRDLRLLPNGAALVRGIPALLDRLQVRADLLERRPGAVSGGEAQRLALVRVLAPRPALLVADEPSSRLDPPVQAATLDLIGSLVDEDGLAVLLITHDHVIAEKLADHVLTLPSGPA